MVRIVEEQVWIAAELERTLKGVGVGAFWEEERRRWRRAR